ncbi:hypothetical protein VB005_01611 [Metarhizium brunneum]
MLWPQAALHTGNGSMGDVVFDTLCSSNVPFINNVTYQLSTVQAAGAALDKTGKPLVLMGHSQAGIPSIVKADARLKLTKALTQYPKQAGCSKTKHLELGKAGIHGRSHMFLMENNNDQFGDHQGLHRQGVT